MRRVVSLSTPRWRCLSFRRQEPPGPQKEIKDKAQYDSHRYEGMAAKPGTDGGVVPVTFMDKFVAHLSRRWGVPKIRDQWRTDVDHGYSWVKSFFMGMHNMANNDENMNVAFVFEDIKKMQEPFSDSVAKEYGPEVSIAHMVLRCGGKVQFAGTQKWLTEASRLPVRGRHGIFVESIDATASHLMCPAFENFIQHASELKFLRLARSPFVDDHCLRQIGRLPPTLLYLDLSNCPCVTANGLTTLWQLKSLRRLDLHGLSHVPDIHLAALDLMQLLPELTVHGLWQLDDDVTTETDAGAEESEHLQQKQSVM